MASGTRPGIATGQHPRAEPPIVCLDFDGTLVDTHRDIANTLNELLEKQGRDPVEPTRVRGEIRRGLDGFIRHFFPNEDADIPGLKQVFRTRYRVRCVQNLEPFPELARFLRKHRQFPLALVTNKPERETGRMVHRLGWKGWLDPILAGDTFPLQKPHPLPLRAVATRWKVRPDQLIMVGDTPTDVVAGKRVGARTVGCLYGFGKEEELRGADPDELVQTPAELASLLKRLITH